LKERDRIRVLEQRQGGQLSQMQAATQLGVCVRQMRRIEVRYAEQGHRRYPLGWASHE
jgi:hypothetical protein